MSVRTVVLAVNPAAGWGRATFPTVYRGTHVKHPAVATRRAREVTLSCTGVTAYADGERLGPLPITLTCVPDAVGVLA